MAEKRQILLKRIEQLLEAGDKRKLRSLLEAEHNSDIAEIVEILHPDNSRIVFDCMDTSEAAEVFEKVDEATRAALLEVFDDDELVELISELDPDEAADVLAELDKEESKEVLESLDREDADQIKKLMVYSEDSAGGIMDPKVLSVTEDAFVNDAIQRIREAELDEEFYTVFVTDKSGHFLGEVRIRNLITCASDRRIRDLIDTDVVTVNVNDDQEAVFNTFKKYELIVAPVLSDEHRLVGRITADRVIAVAKEEAAEDLYAMAGTDAAELESFSILNAARVRMTWLLPCLVGTAVTAFFGFYFKQWFNQSDRLYIFTVAILFSPMIAAISGNAGLQTSAIVVCGLATGDLAALRMRQVFTREVRVAVLVALCCGLVGGVICGLLPWFFNQSAMQAAGSAQAVESAVRIELPPLDPSEHLQIALAFSAAMFSAIMVATTLGLVLPFLFRRIGLDPAISSGPLVTTANDSISAVIYLSLTMLLTA
ncbi:MAG: magnesium transporter [Planctomycetaceae bacterium]|nr:magnesium transporter [Planctomycetaceae bacterium]